MSYTDDGRDHVNLLFRREKGGVQQGVEGKERGEKLAGKVSFILFSFIVIIPVIIAIAEYKSSEVDRAGVFFIAHGLSSVEKW